MQVYRTPTGDAWKLFHNASTGHGDLKFIDGEVFISTLLQSKFKERCFRVAQTAMQPTLPIQRVSAITGLLPESDDPVHIDGFVNPAYSTSLKEMLRFWRRMGGTPMLAGLTTLQSACLALAFMHGEKTLHNDIKPANIFINVRLLFTENPHVSFQQRHPHVPAHTL